MHARTFLALLLLSIPLLSHCTDDASCPAGAESVNGVCTDESATPSSEADSSTPENEDDPGDSSDAGTPVGGKADSGVDAAAPVQCFVDRDQDGVGAGDPVDCATAPADGGATSDASVPAMLANAGGDCDDTNSNRSPKLKELCDGFDNNCDDETDEKVKNACGGPCTRPFDHQPGESCTNGLLGVCAREGTYACQGESAVACTAPAVSASGELCDDGQDNDCDGLTDEPDAVNAQFWYQDCDGDGFAASTTGAQKACTKPANTGACGWTSVIPQPATKTNWDCNDASKNYSPAVTEYGLPVDGSSSSDRNCNGTDDKDLGIVDSKGNRRELCTRLGGTGCGQWKSAAGEYVLTQPACSSSTITTYPAGYKSCSGTIANPGPCFMNAYDGLQLCR